MPSLQRKHPIRGPLTWGLYDKNTDPYLTTLSNAARFPRRDNDCSATQRLSESALALCVSRVYMSTLYRSHSIPRNGIQIQPPSSNRSEQALRWIRSIFAIRSFSRLEPCTVMIFFPGRSWQLRTRQTRNLWHGLGYLKKRSTRVRLRLGMCMESNLNSAFNLSAALIDASLVEPKSLSIECRGNPICLIFMPIAANNSCGKPSQKGSSVRQCSK